MADALDDILNQAAKKANGADLDSILQEAADKPEVPKSRELLYGFKSMPADWQNGLTWLASRFPGLTEMRNPEDVNNRVMKPMSTVAIERYGKDFLDLEPDDRIKRMREVKHAELAQDFPDIDEEQANQSGLVTLGKFGGSLATPTTIMPWGKGYKAAMAIGGTAVAADTALAGLGKTGEIDPVNVAIGAVGGALLAPLMLLAGKKFGAALAKREASKTLSEADQLMTMLQEGIDKKRAAGAPGFDAIQATAKELGVDTPQVNKAMELTNRKLIMNSAEDAAEAISTEAPIGGYIKPQGFVSQLLEPVASRVSQLSKPVFGRLREHEFNVHSLTHEAIEAVDPFFKEVDNLPKASREAVQKALLDGEFDIVEGAFKGNQKALDAFEGVQKVLRNSYDDLVKVGYKNLTKIPNYFPRLIDDVDGLMKTLKKSEQSIIEKSMAQAENKLNRSLNVMEKTDIINKTLRGFRPREMPTRFSKKRELDTIPDHLMPFYANPRRSMHIYLRETINDVQKRKFFGRHVDIKKGTNAVDLENSIGAFVDDTLKADPIAARELKKLLMARFYAGEQSPHRFVQTMKNLGYTATLGNPLSAIVQLGDVGVAMYAHGWRNTIASIIGKQHVKAVDFGIIDAAKELSASPSKTARILEGSLKWSGFNRMDRFGKDTILNAAYRKYTKLANTEKGRKIVESKYREIFGDETTALLDDLRNKRVTDNVKLLLWNELSDVQPISLSEMPLKYLQAPNGRIFYMLKTFTIKQLDMLRKEAFREMRNGNVIKGTKNLVYFMTMFTAANMGTDALKRWIVGQKLEADDLPDMFINNLYKNFAATEWSAGQMKRGKVGAVLEDYGAPPLGILDSIGTDIAKAIKGDKFSSETLKYVPIFGKMMYYWQGAGLEKRLKKEAKDD
jgi:hypothetical protein